MSRGRRSSSAGGTYLAIVALVGFVIYAVLRKWADQLGLTVEIVFGLGVKSLVIVGVMGFFIHQEFCRLRSTLPAGAAAFWFALWPAIDKWGETAATTVPMMGYGPDIGDLPFWTSTWFKLVVLVGILVVGYALIHWWDEN